MDICLLSQSSHVRDFIYLIKKILKKGTGISEVSQRLYKPMKAKSDYQKPQLKRPSNVFPTNKKTKPAQSVKMKQNQQQEESFQEPKILESIVTTQSDQIEEEQKEIKSIKQIPKTFLQTMAYNMKEQGLINKLKNTLKDQIKYLQDRINFYNNQVSKKQVIQISWQELESKDRTDRLKAWSYHRAQSQMDQMNKDIDLFLIPLGFVLKEKNYKTSFEQMEKQIQKQSGMLELCLSNLNDCKQLNFFDNENVNQITQFLIYFQEAFDCCESTRQIFLNENSYCDALHTLRLDALQIFNQIKQKYSTFFNTYQQQDGQQKIFHTLLDIRLYDMVNYFILQKAEYIPKHYQDILGYMDRILELEKCLQQYEEKLPHVIKLLKLRDKQLKTLEIVINFINSSHTYSKSLLVEMFYYKEIKLLELNLTTFDYLMYLSQQVNELQTQLLMKQKFVSSINLKIMNIQHLNQKEEIAEVKQIIISKEKINLNKTNPLDRNKEYIKQIESKFKQDQEFVQKRLVKEDDRLKVEKENKIERLKARLLKSNINMERERKRNEFFQRKYQHLQQSTNNQIQQIIVGEKKNQDVLGQFMFLIQDARFKLFKIDSKQYSDQIIDFYHQHMYKQGFPKKLQLSKLQHLKETISQLSDNYYSILNQYLQDKQYKGYIEITKKTEFIKETQNLDFYNYSLALSVKLLYLIDYHDKFYTVNYLLQFKIPSLPEYDYESILQFFLRAQKNAENVYDYLQKHSDQYLRIEWHTTNKFKCSENAQEKLFQIIKNVNHCTILRFEVIRYILHQFQIEIFENQKMSFNVRQIAQLYTEQAVQQQLQNKIKYFPKLIQQILNQIEPFLIYFELSILINQELYYIISLLNQENFELVKIQKVLNYFQNNLGEIDSVELFKLKALQFIISKSKYVNYNIDSLIKNIIDTQPKNKINQQLLEIQQVNFIGPQKLNQNIHIYLILDYNVDQEFFVCTDDYKISKEYAQQENDRWILNIELESRFIEITTNKIPKFIELSVNDCRRNVTVQENILNLPSFAILIDVNKEQIMYLYK